MKPNYISPLIYMLTSILFINCSNMKKQVISSHLFYTGKYASVSVDKIIFTSKNPSCCFVRFQIKNTTKSSIGADMKNQNNVIYPHLFGIYNTNFRTIIREMRVQNTADTLSDSYKQNLLNSFNNLTIIPPDKTIEYYVPVSFPEDYFKIKKGQYLIITCDGHLTLTDGKSIEHICLYDEMFTAKDRDLVFEYPVQLTEISGKPLIVNTK